MMFSSSRQQHQQQSMATPSPPYFTSTLNKSMARYAATARKLAYSDDDLCNDGLAAEVAHDFRRESVKAMVQTGRVPGKLKRSLPGLIENGVDSVLPPRKKAQTAEEEEESDAYDDEEELVDDEEEALVAKVTTVNVPPPVLRFGSIIITLSGPNASAKVSYATNSVEDDTDDDTDNDDSSSEAEEDKELCNIRRGKGKKEMITIKEMRRHAVEEIRGWPTVILRLLGNWCKENLPRARLLHDVADLSELTSEEVQRFFWTVMAVRDEYWKIIRTQDRIILRQAEFEATNVDESIYDYYRALRGERGPRSKPRKIRRGWAVPAGFSTKKSKDEKSVNSSAFKSVPVGFSVKLPAFSSSSSSSSKGVATARQVPIGNRAAALIKQP